MITTVYAYEEVSSPYMASIFLVGPTPRGNDAHSWRPEAVQIISEVAEKYSIDVVVFIPESRDGIYNSTYLDQVEWEKRHLEMADAILAWVPRDLNTSLKGLTTNVEFGKYIQSGKLFYGRPDNADSTRYLDWLYTDMTGKKVANRLSVLVEEVLHYLYLNLRYCQQKIRTAGERSVPLLVWNTPQFQSWYQSQRQAGNRLESARLLWSFAINKMNHLFSYALQVNVWIAAENRVKYNEFIISRSDIAVVVPYWKHPTELLESEILLIKEFRAPARTQDGFVHELPGGSSFIVKSNPLQLASDELFEETSLKIEADRFRYIDSKQLVATWSTHYADVYAAALTQAEIKYVKHIAASGKTFGVEEDTESTYIEVCKLRDVGKYVDWSMEGIIYRTLLNSSH